MPPRPSPPPPAPSDAPPEVPAERLSPEAQRELDQLGAVLQERMMVDPALQSARLTGWRLARPAEDTRRLVLEIVAFEDLDADPLEELARRQMALIPYWTKADPPIADVVVTTRVRGPARPVMSTRYFQIASDAFWRCDPATARVAFQAALEESPDSFRRHVLNYWLVLTDLQMGRADLVNDRLAWLLENDPLGSSSPAVAIELQRVQGPIRMALNRAERDVLLARARPGNNTLQTPPAVPLEASKPGKLRMTAAR